VVAPKGSALVLRDVRRLNVTPTPDLPPNSRAGARLALRLLDRLDPDIILHPTFTSPGAMC